jgi:hypothetical protein
MFYERFSENLTLQALSFGGGRNGQLDLVVSANDDPIRRAAACALLQQPSLRSME